ncbi:DUF4234 domain-containing protein [Gordonia sp. DT30]|uniref:DUF4234 domain-containing protein n=1 Tax=Gordonia sp. DT30 TaxID=3416546 RepID=UPI003CF8A36E
MTTPQNPDGDQGRPLPSQAPTTHHPTQPPPAPGRASGPDGGPGQFQPAPPTPSSAPTRVHTRPTIPTGAAPTPPAARGPQGHPPAQGERAAAAVPPVAHIPPGPPAAQPAPQQFTPPPLGSGPVPGQSFPSDQAPVPGGRRPVADGQQMKKRNPLAVWLGLPLITLGIYSLVWYYKIHKELAAFDRRKEISAVGPLLVVLLLSWTVVAPIISFHNTGKRIREAQRSAGLPETCNPTLCWLLGFVFGLHTFYMQGELNKIVDAYGVEHGTTVPLFV